MAFITREKFKPAVEVQVMVEDPSRNRRAPTMAARSRVTFSDAGRHKSEVLALPTQGLLFTTLADQSAVIWADAILTLSSECLKFLLNAVHDTQPHNHHIWKKNPNASCPVCGFQRQTLIHVLNNCSSALNFCRCERHDGVLKEIDNFIKDNLSETAKMIVDLSGEYKIPSHLPCTDLRPDLIWWDT